MRKIPTVFVRDPEDRKHLLPEVTPGCEWVLAGEGVATRKYDGTCVMVAAPSDWELNLWKRREVKPGKPTPVGFVEADHDEATGKRFGWVLCHRSDPGDAVHFEAFDAAARQGGLGPGTYELCGPKINGNPEGYIAHVLVPHAGAQRICGAVNPTYESLKSLLTGDFKYEGIVWHHLDGRMAKIKVRDFV